MMTLERAYALLEERWPNQTFCITFNAWHYEREIGGDRKRVEWQIWDAKLSVHHNGPSLEVAMELALGCDADLATVARQIEHFADGSGYILKGRLDQ